MKSFVSMFVFFTATAAMACPNLAGTYLCPDENGNLTSPLQITEEVKDGVLYYTTTEGEGSSTYPTDNVEHPFKEESDNLDVVGTFRGWCEGNVFKELVQGDILSKTNQKVGEMMVNIETQLDASSNLTSAFRSKVVSVDGQVQENAESFTCQRQ